MADERTLLFYYVFVYCRDLVRRKRKTELRRNLHGLQCVRCLLATLYMTG